MWQEGVQFWFGLNLYHLRPASNMTEDDKTLGCYVSGIG